MLRVKVCGITNEHDAVLSVRLGAWALGFIFYEKSPRYIDLRAAKDIIKNLPHYVLPVGVFVNAEEEAVKKIASTCGLKALQFHGDETPAFCKKFPQYRIIKVFRINKRCDYKEVLKFSADAFLFDTLDPDLHGGTGKAFNWRAVKSSKLKRPVILSGGINPKNIKRAIKTVRPYAVDVSSGVEKSPGKKDTTLLRELFAAVENTI